MCCCATQSCGDEASSTGMGLITLSPGESCFISQTVGQEINPNVTNGNLHNPVHYNPLLIVGLLLLVAFTILGWVFSRKLSNIVLIVSRTPRLYIIKFTYHFCYLQKYPRCSITEQNNYISWILPIYHTGKILSRFKHRISIHQSVCRLFEVFLNCLNSGIV